MRASNMKGLANGIANEGSSCYLKRGWAVEQT